MKNTCALQRFTSSVRERTRCPGSVAQPVPELTHDWPIGPGCAATRSCLSHTMRVSERMPWLLSLRMENSFNHILNLVV
jgi:hypothetical protein